MSIPRVIHQMWFDRFVKDNEIVPEKYVRLGYPDGWRNLNTTFQYVLWNGQKIDRLFESEELTPWRSFFHDRRLEHIERCDFARYGIMIVHGGIYVDLDFKCLRSILPLLEQQDGIGLVFEPPEHTNRVYDAVDRRLYNGFMMSAPGHWVWKGFADYIVKNYKPGRGPLANTGPVAFARYAKEIGLMENHPEFFIPTCLIMPLISRGNISSTCNKDVLQSAFALTKWNEGTDWGRLTLDGRNLPMMSYSQKKRIWIIMIVTFLLIIIILIVVLLVYFLKKK